MPRRHRHRRSEADNTPGVTYRAAEEDAEPLFGGDGPSIFLRPSAPLVKFFLAVEIVIAALITIMVVLVLVQAVCVFMMPQVPEDAPSEAHVKWRLPYPQITPCDPSRGNSTVCSTTAFTPGPSSALEYQAPPAAAAVALIAIVSVGLALVVAALRLLWTVWGTISIPKAVGLVVALPAFPVSSWLIEAAHSGVFRFLRSGYGAPDEAPIRSPHSEEGSNNERSVNASLQQHAPPSRVPNWAWLDKLLLITAHPGLLLLRARGEFTVTGGAKVATGSVFRHVPRAAAEVIGRVLAGAGFQWVLAGNAFASRRSSSRLFIPALFGITAAVLAFAAAFFVALTHGDEMATRSDALDRWAAAVGAVPSVIRNTSALAQGSVVPLYTGWSPLTITAQETVPVFIRAAEATFWLCAVVVFFVASLQVSAPTWQLQVAQHVTLLHDMSTLTSFFVMLVSFSQIADPGTPTLLPYAPEYDVTYMYGPAVMKRAMDDLRGLAGLWSCATRGANLTQLPFDRVTFTALHPAAAAPILRTAVGQPNGTVFPSVTAPTAGAFVAAAASPAVFTSVPWAVTWPTAMALLSVLVPGACFGLFCSVRERCLALKKARSKPAPITGTAGALFFSFLIIPWQVLYQAISLLVAPFMMSFGFSFGIMSPMARDIHLPFAALVQGLCDEAGKWTQRRCALVGDDGTAAVQVFKTLCDAAQPPPPATVSDGLADTTDVEEWIGAARRADGTLQSAVPFDIDSSDDEADDCLMVPLLPAVPVTPCRISEMSQRERRALIATEQARLGAAFAALEERYFSLPAAERSLFAVVDFFDAADTQLAEDFALFWVTHRTTVASCVTNAIVAERSACPAIAGGVQDASRRAQLQPFRRDVEVKAVVRSRETEVDAGDDEAEAAAADVSDSALNHDRCSGPPRAADILSSPAAELTTAAHAADLFKHFDARARRDFEDYCKRRVAVTARWQHGSSPTDQLHTKLMSERRVLVATQQARLGAAFAALEERYFSLPAAERSPFAIVDFFADARLAEDFGLFWVIRFVADTNATDKETCAAIIGTQCAPRKALQLCQRAANCNCDEAEVAAVVRSRETEVVADDDEVEAADVSDAALNNNSGSPRAVDLLVEEPARDEAAKFTTAAHAADLFKHFDARSRPIADPDRTVKPSFVASSGPNLFRIYAAVGDCAPLPETERVLGAEKLALTNPVAWVDEASYSGRVPFFALASSIRSAVSFVSFVKARRWLLHRGGTGGTARRVTSAGFKTSPPPLLVWATSAFFFLATLVDVPFTLLTCRRTTSTWSMRREDGYIGTDCAHWRSPLEPPVLFTQVGATTEHSTECVPALGLVLCSLRVACLLALLCLCPALKRALSRGFLWSLAASGVPSGPTPPAPWESTPDTDAIPQTSELHVGKVRHVVDAAALEHLLSHPASDSLQLAVECVVDAVAPHPAVTLLTEISHHVVPLALTARITSPFLPPSSLV